jgi:hypothetical protein
LFIPGVFAGPPKKSLTIRELKRSRGNNEMIDYQYLKNPNHWRDRAQQTLAKAQQEVRPETRDRLRKIAREYEQLAERAEGFRSPNAEQNDAQVVI